MNANELADIVDHWAYKESAEYLTDAATMLRQQQAEIEALKDSLYEKGFIDGMAKMTESAVHRAVEGMAAKELTVMEVMSEHCTCYKLGYNPLNDYRKVKAK
jgi:hypothetical protein